MALLCESHITGGPDPWYSWDLALSLYDDSIVLRMLYVLMGHMSG